MEYYETFIMDIFDIKIKLIKYSLYFYIIYLKTILQ